MRMDNLTYLKNKIWTVYDECQYDNWDGYQATRVTSEAYAMALKLAEALPEDLLKEDIDVGADPDGDVTFEWYYNESLYGSLCIGEDGHLIYDKVFGFDANDDLNITLQSTKFDGKTIPEEILEIIRSIGGIL